LHVLIIAIESAGRRRIISWRLARIVDQYWKVAGQKEKIHS
jgi:hypothetical protein